MKKDEHSKEESHHSAALSDIPVEVRVTVGVAHPTIGELLKLKKNDVLRLDKKCDDLLDLFVGDKRIACGELEELEGEQGGQLAIRLKNISENPEKR